MDALCLLLIMNNLLLAAFTESNCPGQTLVPALGSYSACVFLQKQAAVQGHPSSPLGHTVLVAVAPKCFWDNTGLYLLCGWKLYATCESIEDTFSRAILSALEVSWCLLFLLTPNSDSDPTCLSITFRFPLLKLWIQPLSCPCGVSLPPLTMEWPADSEAARLQDQALYFGKQCIEVFLMCNGTDSWLPKLWHHTTFCHFQG